MATGGGAVETHSRVTVTCSVCLEPFRGRHPKLLPCFHTFCLPCLTQLTTEVLPGEGGGSRNSITCPTCRTTHSLPPAGVRALQANFYIDDSDPTDTDDTQGQQLDASVSRTQQAGDLEDDLEVKVKGQLKVMEAVMSRLAEEEEEVERQRKVVEQDIQDRYHTGVRMLGECREECLVSLREAATRLTDKVLTEKLTASLVMTSLTDLLAAGSSASSTRAQSALLSESALRHFRQQGSVRQQQPSLFSYTKTTNMAAVSDGLRQLMGSVAPSGGVRDQQRSDSGTDSREEVSTEFLQLLTNASYAELVKLRHDLTTLQTQVDTHTAQLQDAHLNLKEDGKQLREDNTHLKSDNKQLKEDNKQLQEDNKQFKEDNTQLKEDIQQLKDDVHNPKAENKQLTADRNTVQAWEDDIGQMRSDMERVQSEMASLRQDMDSLRSRVTDDVGEVRKEVAVYGSLPKELATITSTVSHLQKDVAAVQKQIGTLNTPVYFTAQLTKNTTLSLCETLILDKAVTNVGGGYDVTTGVFTAPLTATYLFIATARADGDFDCLKSSNKYSLFDITVEGQTVACLGSKGLTSCTAHAVVRLHAGHRARLVSRSAPFPLTNEFRGDGFTSFSGVLVQPEL